MTDYSELKRLAKAFPADLDWDSNTEPFFNGPSGESLGGGATGFYCVYGKPFRLEGEDYDYDGPTYVEACNSDFAKFMVAARDGVLELIAENERLQGLQPAYPPRPPDGYGLPRYGLRWNGPQQPLAVQMDDGYWTPWHLAADLLKDAERYRCLRATENWEDAFVGTPVYFEIYLVESRDGSDNKSGAELDTAVDTLIGLRSPNEG